MAYSTSLLILNAGVMKSAMGELTDTTNRGEGFSLLSITWGFGATMGYVACRNSALTYEISTGLYWEALYPTHRNASRGFLEVHFGRSTHTSFHVWSLQVLF